MFGSKNSGQLRWCVAALVFVWAAAFAGIASAGGDKVTICHFPPGNPANFQQITIAAQGLGAHLAHGDFLGPCASDCTVNQTLCSTPPDQCHQAGTCNASTGLCQFPLQSDGMACTGPDGRCDSCENGACIGVSSCPPIPGAMDLCTPTDGGTCVPEFPGCGIPAPSTIVNGNPPFECYAIAIDPQFGTCIETCAASVCGDGDPSVCGNAKGCMTNADCPPQTIGSNGPVNKCVTASCSSGSLCVWQSFDQGAPICPPGDGCDPMFGCYALTPTTP